MIEKAYGDIEFIPKKFSLMDDFESSEDVMSFGDVIFSFGNTSLSNSIIPQDELNEVGSEGFIVRNRIIVDKNITILACNGNFCDPNPFDGDQIG